MSLPQPGKVQKFDTGITLGDENDLSFVSLDAAKGSRFLYNGSQFCISQYDQNTHLREMNIWSNDGSEATNFFFNNKYLLDIFYDSHDQAYYGIRWNNDKASQGSGFDFSDFSESAETATTLIEDQFNSEKNWQVKDLPHVRSYIGDKYHWVDYRYRNILNYSTSTVDHDPYPPTADDTGWSDKYNENETHDFFFYKYRETEDRSVNLLQVDEDNSRLIYFSNTGVGYLQFDVEVGGDFVAFADIDVTTFGKDSVLALRALRESDTPGEPFNQLGSVSFFHNGTSFFADSWAVDYSKDSTGNYWGVNNLRISERYLTPTASGSSLSVSANETLKISVSDYYNNMLLEPDRQQMVFSVTDSSSTNYGYGLLGSDIYDVCSWVDGERTNPGVVGEPQDGGEVIHSYRLMGFDIKPGYVFDSSTGVYRNYIDAGIAGSSIDVKLTRATSAANASTPRLAIKRIGTTLYFMVDDHTSPGSFTLIDSVDLGYDGPVKFELYADATARWEYTPEIAVRQFIVRDLFPSEGTQGTASASWPHPVFTLETYDVDGNRTEVTGVSDSSGLVLSNLDTIKKGIDSGGDFDDYLGKVQIATNHGNTTASGEVYVNINTDFYKYLKDAIPITTVESGTNASVLEYGSLIGTPYYNTLDWNMYTQGGLIYAAENEADPGSGLYLNVLRHTTMTPNDPVKFAWIEESDATYNLFAVDVNEPHLLYGFSQSDRKVYIYNLDEDASAFCNVVSQKQIVGANTAETSLVTAQVVNIYGDPLELKTVNFVVSSGDGSVSPASNITNSIGEATTTYTVGSTVGTSTLNATVTD